MSGISTTGMVGKIGLPPGSLLHVGNTYNDTVKLTMLKYTADIVDERELTSLDELPVMRDPGAVTWIRVIGLHDTCCVEQLGERFAIHPLVLEDILNTHRRPKFEDHGDYFYIVLKSLRNAAEGEELVADQVSVIVGGNYVISLEERDTGLFAPLRERIMDSAGRVRKQGPDYLAYALLDIVVDNYFLVLETIGDKIETLEEELVVEPGPNAPREIHHLKRQMLLFRKALWPLREIAGALSRGEAELIQAGTLLYLRDIYDHTIQVLDTLETYRDILSGMLDIYLSSISNRMNQIMKMLTIISTIFIPLTFIAGVYGMNFKYMPELNQKWGYPAVLAVMLIISLGMIRYFRTRKWL